MADRVLRQFDRSLEAYATGDAALAETVIETDHEVNLQYLALEQSCIDLIALQQPVASDLRFIAATFKILTDLERIGDLAVNLADYATWEGTSVIPPNEMHSLGEQAGTMVSQAVDAYEANDVEAAREIAAADDGLDDRCLDASNRVIRGLIEDTGDLSDDGAIASRMHDASRTFLTIRDIERVGDHGVNICARTLYMVENDDELIY